MEKEEQGYKDVEQDKQVSDRAKFGCPHRPNLPCRTVEETIVSM